MTHLAIGIYEPRHAQEVAKLRHVAKLYDAVPFTVGGGVGDMLNLRDLTALQDYAWPLGALIVPIELDLYAKPLSTFTHPTGATMYLLGPNTGTLPKAALNLHEPVFVETAKPGALPNTTAGAIVLHHRYTTQLGAA